MMKSLLLELKARRVVAELKKRGVSVNKFAVYGHGNMFDCYSVEAWVNTWYNGLFKKKMTAEDIWTHVKAIAFYNIPVL